jgi:hypothetical protein
MREKAINPRNGSVIPLPPQIFYNTDYLGVSLGKGTIHTYKIQYDANNYLKYI